MTDATTMLRYRVGPGGRLQGRLRVPGDKSVSHRFAMLSALADGESTASGFLEGEDALATCAVFRAMGVEMDGPVDGHLSVRGVGRDGLERPSADLDLGNSGTAMRLLCGLMAGQRFDSRLVGDASLSKRPMRRVADPLRAMGARIATEPDGTPPIGIEPAPEGLAGIDYRLPMASAQVKSCLLLAGLYATGRTQVTEPAVTRDHTERMLRAFGVAVDGADGVVGLDGGQRLTGVDIGVPADISSAAFFAVGASIARGSDVLLEDVGMNPTRDGVIRILRLMGANLALENERAFGGEPVADIRVRSAPLVGREIPRELVPLAIDEFPAVFVAACCAEGRTVVSGARELRVKESDRIQAMADALSALGAVVQPTEDGMIIEGSRAREVFSAGTVTSQGDHRIAMAMSMAALRASGPIEVEDCANVATSFPGFERLARSAGLDLDIA